MHPLITSLLTNLIVVQLKRLTTRRGSNGASKPPEVTTSAGMSSGSVERIKRHRGRTPKGA